jgi:hypothetical protein
MSMKTFARLSLLLLGLALAAATGCGSPVVDIDPVPADYQSWYRVDTTGALPGHGDTYRIIYANDVAQTWAGAGEYAIGSIVVKEIHELDSDGGPGALDYIAVMRKLDSAPAGAELRAHWLFTYLGGDIGSDEEYRSSCWDTCHAAAPYEGLFLDYGGPR